MTKKKLLSFLEGDDFERVTEIVFGPKTSVFEEVTVLFNRIKTGTKRVVTPKTTHWFGHVFRFVN
jgi:hypothetical protein